MNDIEAALAKAREDRIVDSGDLKSHLANFSIEDWRKLTKMHTRGQEMLNDFWVEEKEDKFVVHNDKDAINDASILKGVGNLLKGVVATGVGALVGRYGLSRAVEASSVQALSRISPRFCGVAGAAIGIIGSVMYHRSTMSELNELAANSYSVDILKSSLSESKVASLLDKSSNESAMLFATNNKYSLKALG